GVVETARDLNVDPQLAARGHFVPVQHEVLGRHTCEKLGYALSAMPGAIERQGPMLGEDSAYVYSEILRLSDDAIATLREDGVLAGPTGRASYRRRRRAVPAAQFALTAAPLSRFSCGRHHAVPACWTGSRATRLSRSRRWLRRGRLPAPGPSARSSAGTP